jgi:protein-tyrosine phosphatase
VEVVVDPYLQVELLDVAALEVVVEEEQVTQVVDHLPIVDLVKMELKTLAVAVAVAVEMAVVV